jgi:hypothetical protein
MWWHDTLAALLVVVAVAALTWAAAGDPSRPYRPPARHATAQSRGNTDDDDTITWLRSLSEPPTAMESPPAAHEPSAWLISQLAAHHQWAGDRTASHALAMAGIP